MTTRRKSWLAAMAMAMALAGGLIPTSAAATETVAGTEAADGRQRDRAAFERILRQQEDAWAAEDGTAFAATFTEDADLVTFNGDYLVTRQGIAVGMQHAFDMYIPPSRIVRLGEHIRFLEPDLAIIVRTSCVIDAGQETCRSGSHSRNTNVLRKRHGGWLQTSFQNTRIEPLP
ncbi:SgcJ/EcaC family oxidoreductase [Plantactinospora solaniradicis]|uniref:SgcJ/EcaC family oxidoreductase n=1 Tax=Plantactinospora solaniradicis TaxID=1723736 RepID=A0ABW1KE25_9ACTN